VPAVVKDPTDPAYPHGTERGYFRAPCRCQPCINAHTREGHLRALRVQREGDVVDLTAKAQTHLLSLLGDGVVLNDLARATGLRWRTVHAVVAGIAEAPRRPSLRKMLALTPEDVRDSAYWGNRTLAQQQIGSLMRLGWPGDWIEKRVGVNVTDLHRYERITAEVCRRVAAVAAEVGDRPGPSSITAARAKRAGWRVPGAYDAEGNLIPGAALDDEDPRLRAKRLIAERRADVHRLYDEGYETAEVAARLGISRDLAQADRARPVFDDSRWDYGATG
jgi:hypothetical protein